MSFHTNNRHYTCLAVLSLLAGLALGGPATRASGDSSFPDAAELPVQTNLPDPLIQENGEKVTTPEQWAMQRERMKAIIEHYAIGHAPPPPGNVTGAVSGEETVLEGRARFRLVHLSFGPDRSLGFDAALYIPAETPNRQGPFPTIVQPSFSSTPGVNFTPVASGSGHHVFAPVTAADGATNYIQALARGYAVMTFYYEQCGADNTNFAKSAFFPAYPDYDWRDLRAWAWGMSRCVDYLETQPFVDKTKILAVGHSRLGKATLVAGAFDDRFALAAPCGSGCGGTGAYRFNGKTRGGKEGLEDVNHHFPQWMIPRLGEFSGRVERLPFDQNWLIALVAPRVFIAPDGLNDAAANENALAHAWLGAKPVYDFLGAPDHLGIHFRPGKHMLAPADWQAILDFSDQQLRGMKVAERFDQLPPMQELH